MQTFHLHADFVRKGSELLKAGMGMKGRHMKCSSKKLSVLVVPPFRSNRKPPATASASSSSKPPATASASSSSKPQPEEAGSQEEEDEGEPGGKATVFEKSCSNTLAQSSLQ